jgi:hypothetical protein
MTQQDNTQSISPDAMPPVTGEPKPDQGTAHPSPASSIIDSRAVPIGHIFTWLADAWGLFKQRPGAWLGFALFFAGICAGAIIITDTSLVFYIFTGCHIALIGHAAFSCDLLRQEERSVTFWSFCGFDGTIYDTLKDIPKECFSPAMRAILLHFGICVALSIIAITLFAGNAIHVIFALHYPLSPLSSLTAISFPGMMYAMMLFIVAITVCDMAFCFAPALMYLHNIPLVDALNMSWSASRKNIPGIILLCFVTNILLGTIAVLLYQLIMMPVSIYFMLLCTCIVLLFYLYIFMLICSYTAYRDIFFDKKHEQHA